MPHANVQCIQNIYQPKHQNNTMQTLTQQLYDSFFNPKHLIKSLKHETVQRAIILFTIVQTATIIIQFILAKLFPTSFYAQAMQDLNIWQIILSIPFSIVTLIIFVAIIHLFLKLFGSKKEYNQTLIIVAFAAVPSSILGLLPYLGVIASTLYFFGISILAIKEIHKVSTIKAVTSIFAPILLLVLILLLFFAALFSSVVA